MNLSTYQIFIAIAIFLSVTFILIRSTYKKYAKEYGEKKWKLDGSRTNYLRVLTLLSITITVVIMLILKGTVLS